MESKDYVSGKTFLAVWALLTILTVLLLVASFHAWPMKEFWITLMALAQAYLVIFYFMHLRFEKLPLVLSVVLGVLITTGLLFLAIVWDGSRIVKISG